ncbi:MAG: hypothetical protein U1F43_20465 [Myxococcota bacterium]
MYGGNKRLRYGTALAGACEVAACFDVAVAMAFLPGVADGTRAALARVIGTLVKLSR